MNNILKKEIITHIFKALGAYKQIPPVAHGMFEDFVDTQFLIEKKVAFEVDNKKYQNNVWATKAQIENSSMKIMIADTHEDIPEYTVIVQMDTFPPCAIRLSEDKDDYGSVFFNVEDNKWIAASTLLQAKILVGIEELSEMLLKWENLEQYGDMYKVLIGFLNFYEQVSNEG